MPISQCKYPGKFLAVVRSSALAFIGLAITAHFNVVVAESFGAAVNSAELGSEKEYAATQRHSMLEKSPDSLARASGNLFQRMQHAWRTAEDKNKVVMLVIVSESCDRCALLQRYMDDDSLSDRIEKHFIRVDLSTTAFKAHMAVDIPDEQLPAIILVESEGEFQGHLPTDRLLTFRPESYEPMYDWMENLLFYSDQVFAAYAGE